MDDVILVNEENRDRIIPLLKISPFQFDAILAVLDIGVQAIEPIRELDSQVYTWPLYEQKMYVIDIILDAYGLECIFRERAYEYIDPCDSSIRAWLIDSKDPFLIYCNKGDAYQNTICYETRTGRFFVESWGDWYERNMRQIEPESMTCPRCGGSDTDITTIKDHGMCYNCHKMWQWGELPEQQEEDENATGIFIPSRDEEPDPRHNNDDPRQKSLDLS